MAQKRYWNFEDDDSTDAINRWLLGVNKSGVYCGFDLNKTGGPLVLRLSHEKSGVKEVDIDLDFTDFMGVVMTNQGVVIKEDEPVDIILTANANLNPRIDLVVIEHEYIETLGGAAATYSVINGTPSGTPVAPALTNPEKQTIIGYLFVPGSFSDIATDSVEWIRNVKPFANEKNYSDWNTLSYNTSTKVLSTNAENDNLFKATLTSTKEVSQIELFSKLGKSVLIWFQTDGTIITGGNIDLTANLKVVENSFVEFLPYRKGNGRVAWKIISHFRNSNVYSNEVTKFTKTFSFGEVELVSGLHYVAIGNLLLTGTDGNLIVLTIANGDSYKNFAITNSPSLTEHSEGTILYFRITTPTGVETATLDFVSSSLFKLDSGEANTITLRQDDEFYAIKRGIKWVIVPLSFNQRRINTLESGKAAKGGPLSAAYSVLGTNLETYPLTSPNGQLYYKDELKRVHFCGRQIKATGVVNIGSVLFTLQASARPYNTAPIQLGNIFVALPLLSISTPTVMITLEIATNGEVRLYDTGLAADDLIDLRGISFLGVN